MEFGLYSQPPVSKLFSLFQDAIAFHGEWEDPNNGFSIYLRMVYVFIYIYIYIYNTDMEFGFYPQPPVSNLFFAFSRRRHVSRCAERLKQWL